MTNSIRRKKMHHEDDGKPIIVREITKNPNRRRKSGEDLLEHNIIFDNDIHRVIRKAYNK